MNKYTEFSHSAYNWNMNYRISGSCTIEYYNPYDKTWELLECDQLFALMRNSEKFETEVKDAIRLHENMVKLNS